MVPRNVATALLGRLREGRLEIAEAGGRRLAFGPADSSLRASVRLHDSSFWGGLTRGSLGLAESYADGRWDCDDLVSLVRIGAREMPRLDRLRRPFVPLLDLLSRVPRNTRDAAPRHIEAHYDLGNGLFGLFLDNTMTYSCAIFEHPEVTLREAQQAKLDRVCRKLELTPEDHVLEIGTGWGSFAVHAAGRFGSRVTTTTISRQQYAAAAERIRAAGLEDRVTVLLSDYRDLRGRYDKLVSIEMIEAVGWQYFDTFFRRCGDLLSAGGLMLLQAIVIDHRAYHVERSSRSFMRQLIFPSGCLPSLEVISDCVARSTEMRILDVEDITANYPETLRRWRAAFLDAAGRAQRLGYDRRFRRLWELYFAYCEGGFRERRIQTVQTLLARPGVRGRAPRRRPVALIAGG